MELPWTHRRCIVCLRDDVDMTRAHLVPESLGGFVWARTHCAGCNNSLGARVESGVKHDPTIRYAVEHALGDELPELAQAFAEGQPYFVPSDRGPLAARYRAGAVELGTTKLDDGSLVQDRERAAQTIETMLARAGADAAERVAALERIAAADVGELVDVGRGLAIRHGTGASASMTFDGERVSDEFPLAIAYHLLAYFVGELIYVDALEPIRAMLRGDRPLDASEVLVESLIDRSTGYVPRHVLGLSRVEPHLHPCAAVRAAGLACPPAAREGAEAGTHGHRTRSQGPSGLSGRACSSGGAMMRPSAALRLVPLSYL
jgi:hypothetical protein